MPEFPDDIATYTGMPDWHAVYTVQLGELIEDGVFDWNAPELDWKSAAYSNEQYDRVCAYFVERFRFREISIIPYLEWAYALRRMLVYELMPKYKPLYDAALNYNPLAESDEYYKRRTITSDYPETLLSANADYISDGIDEEWERVTIGNVSERLEQYKEIFTSIDESLLDELETLFICMYTVNANAL